MDVEQQMRETYAERLGAVDLSGGDVDAARRTGARMRVRRRLAVGAAAVAVVVAVGVGGTIAATRDQAVGPAAPRGHWRELPTPPLSPRADAVSVWTGHEVIVLGGDPDPCPPGADCATTSSLLRDGAAYDPATGAWHRIADAPVPVGPGDRLVPYNGAVVLRHAIPQGGARWFSYEPEGNRWLRMGHVPAGAGDPSVIGPRLYALAGRRVATYDVSRFAWSLLPPDPIRPRLTQRRVTATPYGPVVTGLDATQPNDGRAPSVVLADVFDGKAWQRLPATGQLGNDWFWDGDRMVAPDPATVDGGEVDPYPHAFPAGGQLDPSTGRWSPLPDALTDEAPDGWGVNAAGGHWVATYGQVYSTETGDVWVLPKPEGAIDLDTTAAWAGDQLLVFGGATFDQKAVTTDRAWLYTP